MSRQRARCRNPECGTFDIGNHETLANDLTPAGLYKGIVIALSFVVLCVAGTLGLLAMASSLFWAACCWIAGGLLLYALAKAGRRLDTASVIQYHYSCTLCGRVWGDLLVDEEDSDLAADREAVAA